MSSPARRAPPSGRGTTVARENRTRVQGSGTATPEGSATQTLTSTPHQPDGLVLRLRGAHEQEQSQTEAAEPSTRRRIQWAEDVVDNEGLGRKKSKVCCIFHKSREVGESSSEDDSSSSESDGGSGPSDDDGAARPVGGRRGRRKGRSRKHDHDHEHKDEEDCGHGENRKPSPNAYERMPRYDIKPLEKQPGS